MIDRLEKMESFDADICKIAVMPQNKNDVVRLLNVTYTMSRKLSKPLITMSMGTIGVISRICGETFGSSLTFASQDHFFITRCFMKIMIRHNHFHLILMGNPY